MWPQTPDGCVRNIVWVATGMFLLGVVTQMHAYRSDTLDAFIFFVSGLNPVGLALVLVYYRRYHWVKKNNIVPIQNKQRDLTELWELYLKDPENTGLSIEVERTAEQLARMMREFLKRKQFIYIRTYNYDGYIGTVGEVFDQKRLTIAETKGVMVKPRSPIDLTKITFMERVPENKVSEHWLARQAEKDAVTPQEG